VVVGGGGVFGIVMLIVLATSECSSLVVLSFVSRASRCL